MKYRMLARTGLQVSEFTLGTWTFGAASKAVQRISTTEAAREIVHAALDAGINAFNTADSYIGAEELLGDALSHCRDRIVIASKVGIMRRQPASEGGPAAHLLQRGLSRRHILGSIEGSLRRLRTDYLDIYLAHVPDDHVDIDETLEAFDQIVKQGKARYVGFSNWPAWLIGRAVEIQRLTGFSQAVALELYYSLLARDIEVEYTELQAAKQLAVFAWSPLSGGFLTGKYGTPDHGSVRGDGHRLLQTEHLVPIDRARGSALVKALQDMAPAYDATVAQLSLGWLLRQPMVTSVILGVGNRHQLAENLRSSQIYLSEEHAERLREITDPQRVYPYTLINRYRSMVEQTISEYNNPDGSK